MRKMRGGLWTMKRLSEEEFVRKSAEWKMLSKQATELCEQSTEVLARAHSENRSCTDKEWKEYTELRDKEKGFSKQADVLFDELQFERRAVLEEIRVDLNRFERDLRENIRRYPAG